MFPKYLIKITLLTLVLSPLVITTIPTQAINNQVRVNKRTSKDISDIIKSVKDKDPQKPVSQELLNNGQTELVSEQKDTKFIFNLTSKKINISSTVKGNISISIPNKDQFDSIDVLDNKIVYSGNNSKVDIIAEAVDGGIRQIINIKSADAPKFYDFPIEITSGDKFTIDENGQAVVKNSQGNTKIAILKPWAKDANGKDVQTWYTIVNNNVLRQNVNFANATFPVVADPTWCGNQINIAEWVDRPQEGGLSLSIDPTWCGRNFDGESGYKEAISKAPYNSQFPWSDRDSNNQTYRYKVMRQQYLCHFELGTFKSRWNLEPWRPLVEWRQLINPWDSRNNYVCNPKA